MLGFCDFVAWLLTVEGLLTGSEAEQVGFRTGVATELQLLF